MKKILLFVILLFMISGCSEHKHHWGYEGETGPEHWGELKSDFEMCSEGEMQTPINIVPTKDIELSPLIFHYNTSSLNVIDNGHSVQVNMMPGSSVIIDGKTYELKQFHFHTPSENHINGKSFPLEAHFVHQAKDGSLAVVAVMFTYGKYNPVLGKIWAEFPKMKKGKKLGLYLSDRDIRALLPRYKSYYEFMGSLTTPPCSEGVKWVVLKHTMQVSREQLAAFYNLLGHANNRPIQPTNGREIWE